ncbi:endonuclease VII [Microbacterium phage OscarSo]|uniref:Endonuclease VII n=1 Tax=Microbacterium phage OscarSo TaxID=2985324 RepID=A0A9X9K2T9_9CAUD|nr:endonuclease VII [Microbacterium phage OscarSo]UYL87156.1 endonuclease VII [Microbacterium phage OscarSo]
MAAAPCKECGRRPKAPGRHRCDTCQLRHEPIGDQVAAARRRLAMIPEDMRLKRSKKILELAPAGTTWCAGCQSFRDLVDFAKGATKCRPCASAVAHEAMVAKTYGITGDDYAALLKRQGGKCAICRARPKSKRLAVDHDHKTGAVRGLLCSRCNHDLMGSAWDSLAIAVALWHYLNTPPASGAWLPPEAAPGLMPVESAVRPSPASDPLEAIVTQGVGKKPGARNVAPSAGECTRPHVLPVGAEAVPGKRGVWRVFVEPDGDPPF